MTRRKPLSFFSKVILGTVVLSKAASGVPIPSTNPDLSANWSAVRRDLQGTTDQPDTSRILALRTAAQLAAGAPLKDTILASYQSADESEYPALDAFWLHHELVQRDAKGTETFLELRTSLATQRPVPQDPNGTPWQSLVTLAYD